MHFAVHICFYNMVQIYIKHNLRTEPLYDIVHDNRFIQVLYRTYVVTCTVKMLIPAKVGPHIQILTPKIWN